MPGYTTLAVQLARAALCCAALTPFASSQAAVFRVGGTASGCTHTTIQAAVAAAESSPGADVIRVARDATYTAQQVMISTRQELEIAGGYDSCSAESASGTTTLDGAGGGGYPVLRLYGDTGTLVRLRGLALTGGDNPDSDHGGGILFVGKGRLELSNVSVRQNRAGYGAGIYVRGDDDGEARLVFGRDVIVNNNIAAHSGGGVYIEKARFDMLEPNSLIAFNQALGNGGGGYGGGLILLAKRNVAYARVGSGTPGLGAIYGNSAVNGGGVAVFGDDPGGATTSIAMTAQLQMYSTVAGTPAAIRQNVASQNGGAIYLRPYEDFDDSVRAEAWLWNVDLEGNVAAKGAAVYGASYDSTFGSPQGSSIHFNDASSIVGWPGAAVCSPGAYCGSVRGNLSRNGSNQPTDGATFHLEQYVSLAVGYAGSDMSVVRGGIAIEGNRGGRLIEAGGDTLIGLNNALVADNESSSNLIRQGGDGLIRISDVTLAGNAVGAAQVIAQGDGLFNLYRSILWQPGKTLLQCSGCDKTFATSIVSERGSLDGGNSTELVAQDPRFLDPAHGDYRPAAGSPAVDHAPIVAGDDKDLLGQPRDVDLACRADYRGRRDIGAYERQQLLPLALNADFDRDTNLWSTAFTTWDGAQNATGSANSGSAHVLQTASASVTRAYGASQCIFLPGPGRYTLNAHGRGSGGLASLADYAGLHWELRHDGGDACNAGPADASGHHSLNRSSSFVRPAAAATIDLAAADATYRSSLLITLTATEGNTTVGGDHTMSAWIDGITLTLDCGVDPSDRIFRDGFEP